MGSEFVDPTRIVRIPLSGVDRWIEIKAELSAGDERRVWTGLIKDGEMTAGHEPRLDPEMVGLTQILGYLLAWSFTDDDGQPVRVSKAALDNLKRDTYREIKDIIEAHDDAARAESDALLKNRRGATGSSGTSPSVAP
jgi:hypothetical protein